MSETDAAARAAASSRERHGLVLGGAVQGVGFRPFVLRLARELSLGGWAQNTGEGLRLEIEGGAGACAAFAQRLFAEAPAHAAPRLLSRSPLSAHGETCFEFEIRRSETAATSTNAATAPAAELLPDLATCADCLRELFDPGDRRHLHPFINCTQCGPRYSIALALPYDRERTTMRDFAMCPACRAEYEDPGDRRFHAQPIACHECGPRVLLADPGGAELAEREAALEGAALAIEAGQIVALKGIGGFHLLVDARSPAAVARLRRRKGRPAKPLAVMMPGLDAARLHCELSDFEETLLTSSSAPIVLVRRKENSVLPEGLAPGNPELGVLLPYSPLHHLLLRRLGFPVVATSGNLSGEVLCTGNEQALARLGGPGGVADLFLLHDRPIARPADDSVLRVVLGRELFLRRGRGAAPATFAAGGPLPPLLAAGGDLKGALALAGPFGLRGGPHLGDLGGETAQEAFLAQTRELPSLAGISPQAVACDLHPDYHSTRLAEGIAETLGIPLVRVPHHHAHLAACLAEHGLTGGGEVLGVIWDGSGYGPDGTVRGGEFLLGSAARCERFASLRPFPLPGGDLAARQPRYAALGLLHAAGIPLASTPLAAAFSPQELAVARAQLGRGLHAPLCTSTGRLFDGVAALLGLRLRNGFEAQAAMELEFAAARDDGSDGNGGDGERDSAEAGAGLALSEGRLDWEPVLRSLLDGLAAGLPVPRLAVRFHRALCDGIVLVARAAGKERVVLGGGCFQNARLLSSCVDSLDKAGFKVLWPRLIPPNDGGLALGQALVAARLAGAEEQTSAQKSSMASSPWASGQGGLSG